MQCNLNLSPTAGRPLCKKRDWRFSSMVEILSNKQGRKALDLVPSIVGRKHAYFLGGRHDAGY